jgi:hypothetical protein
LAIVDWLANASPIIPTRQAMKKYDRYDILKDLIKALL